MIDINLVPEALRKKRRGQGLSDTLNLPMENVIGTIGGLLVLLLAIHICLQGFIFVQFFRHAGLKNIQERLVSDKGNTDRIVTELRTLQAKLKSVENLTTAKRINWSQKLNIISDSLPREIWLSKISLEDKSLLIEGSAVSKNADEMISVGDFFSRLKEQKMFMNDFFSLERGVTQRRKIQATELADFSITAKQK